MRDVLLNIGAVVDTETEHEGEFAAYLIIGKRVYNPNSGKSWDYIGVPIDRGFEMCNKCEHPFENTNLYFFNHSEIRSVSPDARRKNNGMEGIR